MVQDSKTAEMAAVLAAAQTMCAAARTAPKTKGEDLLHTCIVTGDELEQMAAKMEEMSGELGYKFFLRDAGNIRASLAVVLMGIENRVRGMGAGCNYCGLGDCAGCAKANGTCAYGPLDLGIAVGSAVCAARDAGIDNRVMFSAGRTAREMGFFGDDVVDVIGIPLSVSGKSPYFDRK